MEPVKASGGGAGAWLAAALEEGRLGGPFTRASVATAGACVDRLGIAGDVVRDTARDIAREIVRSTVVRRLRVPAGARVVAVGGATLGGSGKTPLAMACAAELAADGRRVTLVGHAHRARPGRARVVADDDPLGEVGDEAILAARALRRRGVEVVVAPSRAEAIAFAGQRADVLVLDGVAQTAPVPAALALLAVDPRAPWGAGALPPLGDLRAPEAVLREACDAIVAVGDPPDPGADPPPGAAPADAWSALPVSAGARVGGELRTWADLGRARVGLLSALARPHRVVAAIAARGVPVRAVIRASDHGPLDRGFFARAARAEVEGGIALWLATPKCAIHLEARMCRTDPGRSGVAAHVGRHAALHAPVGVLEYELVLCGALRERLRRVAAPVAARRT